MVDGHSEVGKVHMEKGCALNKISMLEFKKTEHLFHPANFLGPLWNKHVLL